MAGDVMMSTLFAPDVNSKHVSEAFSQGSGKWTGCDWPMQFGESRLELNGLRSIQALMMARATAGIESADWRLAVHWLSQIENEARTAEEQAALALIHARSGNWNEALQRARRACAIEQKYHADIIWKPLLDLLEESRLSRREMETSGRIAFSKEDEPCSY